MENEMMKSENRGMGNSSIWIINHYAHTPNLPGGFLRHYEIGRRLLEKRYSVSLFSSDFLHYTFRYYKTAKTKKKYFWENVEGIDWYWIRTIPYGGNNVQRVLNMISFAWKVFWIGYKKKERPEVVIGSSPQLFAVFSAWLLSRAKKSKFIFEVRDLWPQSLIDLGEFSPSHPFIWLLAKLEKFLYQRADAIVTLLPNASKYIKTLGISEEKIFWIPNGVDVEKFTLTSVQRENDESHTPFVLMYAGAHGQANALDMILDSAALILEQGVNDILFEFIGDGPEKKNLIEIVKQKKLTNVQFTDPIPSSEIPVKLSNADALVFCLEDSPLFKYGISPNKLFTYLASGKPILLSANSLNNPVQEAGAGISVPPRDPQILAQAVIKLFRMNPQERKEMGKRGIEYVKKYYDYSILTDKYQEVIENVTVEG
jgi:glycosyltransferase involved in cell wall biosynthesis